MLTPVSRLALVPRLVSPMLAANLEVQAPSCEMQVINCTYGCWEAICCSGHSRGVQAPSCEVQVSAGTDTLCCCR